MNNKALLRENDNKYGRWSQGHMLLKDPLLELIKNLSLI